MKHFKTNIFLFAMLTASPLVVNAQTDIDDDEAEAKKKVHVAYSDKDADELLGGVSYIDMEELQKKDHTMGSLDDLNGLIGGWNGSSMWGMDNENLNTNDNGNLPVIYIDGVRRPSNNVLPSEIEQVTFLKGAQAVVLYGAKAAKGVILITTKRGKVDGLQVEAHVNTGWNVAKAFPEYIGSAEYMTLYNEACINDGLATGAKYSQQDIYNHASGLNPYRYPNVNWYSDEYVRKAYNRSEGTLEIQGGADRARFYTNINYYRAEDLINFGKAKDNYTDRFSVRGNVDLKVNRFISAKVDASATFYNANRNKGDFWGQASTMRPNYPENAAPLIPIDMVDPNASKALLTLSKSINVLGGRYFPGGSQNTKKNAIAECYFGGSGTDVSRQFQFDATINYDMNHLIKGLTFKTLFAIDYAAKYSLDYNNEYSVFSPTWSNYSGEADVITGLMQYGDERQTGTKTMSNTNYRQTISWNGHFDYDRTFGDHHVSGILLGQMFTTTESGEYHRYASANLGLQASYDYKKLYYVDLGLNGVHSARLPEGNREALSPTATIGWRLGKEKFMENTPVDDLMFSISASQLNEDADIYLGSKQYYIYDALWSQGGSGFSWNESTTVQATTSSTGVNPVLDFVKRKEFSFNLRGSLFKKLINLDLSFFTSLMDGYIVQNPTSFPSHLQGKPAINFNADRRTGIDFNITAQKQFGKVHATLGLVGTYLYTSHEKLDENKLDEYQKSEGRPLDTLWGLECAGFYTEDDFNYVIDEKTGKGKWELKPGLPKANLGGSVQPGDLKYVDQNGDNSITNRDEIYLGKKGWPFGAPFTYGINLTLKYKDFTLFLLGTGNMGAYEMKNSSYYYPTGEAKYSVEIRNRWTPETAATATLPRLTQTNGANNTYASTFWRYSTDRFDLRKVQLTYDIPSSYMGKVVKAMSVYVQGQNLLTFSPERKHMELNVGSAPQTRFYNLGAKLTF